MMALVEGQYLYCTKNYIAVIKLMVACLNIVKNQKRGIWSLFANPVTYCHDNSSTTPLHIPAWQIGGRFSTVPPCGWFMFSDVPSQFMWSRSPLCSIQEGKSSPDKVGNVPVWFLHLVNRPGQPSCNGLDQDHANLRICVCVKEEEECKEEGKSINKGSFSPLSSTISKPCLPLATSFRRDCDQP